MKLCGRFNPLLLLPVILLLGGTLGAQETKTTAFWPQWRGPLQTGAAPIADPPVKWSDSENVRWKVELPGSGTSTPIIWADRIFIQTAISTGKPSEPDAPAGDRDRGARRGFGGGERPREAYQFALICLDRRTGQILWQKVAREEIPHEGHHRDHGFASHSPLTDGEHVFAYFGSRGLHCFDLEGQLIWSKDLGKMQTRNSFGEGSSPALFQDWIVVNWDHQGEDFIVAFDKRTGQELWRKSRDEDTSWATPIIVEHQGQAQVITAASSKVRAYGLKSGELIWECGPLTANVIPSPVAGEGMVYATSGFRGSALWAIRLGGQGDLAGTPSIAWTHDKQTPYVPSPLLYHGRLYFLASNNGLLTCLDAKTGEVMIDAERLEGVRGVYASPIGAGGRIYLLARDGVALVLNESDHLEILRTNRLDDDFDASPAAAGKELFLRGHKHLYCIAEGPG